MVRIRLSKRGKKHKPSYRIVVCDSRSPRDGKFIEKLGFFNFFNKYKFSINFNRFLYWKNLGAKISKRVDYLIKKYNN